MIRVQDARERVVGRRQGFGHAGETIKTVTVQVTGDTIDEADEAFVVKLSAPVGSTISDASGTATIFDDD